MEVNDKVVKAKTQIMRELGFFSPFVALMRGTKFRVTYTDELKAMIPTAAVDQRGVFWYNPDWFSTLSVGVIKGVLKHEIIHYAMMHCGRGQARQDRFVWNIAADIKTNHILLSEYDNIKLPSEGIIPTREGGYYSSSWVWKSDDGKVKIADIENKTVEEIFDELSQQIPKVKMPSMFTEGTGDGSNAPHGGFDIHIQDPTALGDEPINEQEKQAIMREVREQIADALTKSKQAGNLPQGMERIFGEVLEPTIDWRVELNREIRKEIITDFTYRRPARRSAGAGVFMPSVVREGASMVAAFDVSGSIGQDEITEFGSEIIGAVKQFPQLELTVISHDTKVHSVNEFRTASESDIMNMELKGGGGTSHEDVFRWVQEHKPTASLIVCFTDGYSDQNEIKPPKNTRVLWVLNSRGCSPKDFKYGKVIKVRR